MRAFLDAILAFISAASLSDAEFSTITLQNQDYSAETYLALLSILDSRETVSGARDRLKYYFLARGTEVVETSTAKTNILVGGVLCN